MTTSRFLFLTHSHQLRNLTSVLAFVLLLLAMGTTLQGQSLPEEEGEEENNSERPQPPRFAPPGAPPSAPPGAPPNWRPPVPPPNFRPGGQAPSTNASDPRPTPADVSSPAVRPSPASRPSPVTTASPTKPDVQASSEDRLRFYGSWVSPDVDLDEPFPSAGIAFSDLDTQDALQMIENFTRKPILRQQSLPTTKLSLMSEMQNPPEMTIGEVIVALESMLALNGIALTPVGDRFLKAVPATSITQQVPPLLEGDISTMMASQKIFSRFYRLDFLTVEEAVQIVQPLLSQGSPLAFGKQQSLLITDALVNLLRIDEILARLDQPSPMKQEMLFFRLRNISANDLLQRLQSLQKGSLARQLENNTFFEADERGNQLLVFTHPSNAELITQLVERFDIDVAPLTSTRIFNIKHAEAPVVTTLIEQIVTGQKQSREEQARGNSRGRPTTRPAPNQPNPNPQAAISSESSLQFSDFLTIVADERANTIVASGTSSDLRFLEKLITDIDVLLAQVRIEVVITEVTLTEGLSRGIDAFNFAYRRPGASGFDGAAANDANVMGTESDYFLLPSFASGLAFGAPVTVRDFALDVLFSTAESNSNVQILSAPTIVTTHNREATISVGESRPITTSEVSDTVNTSAIRNQIQYRDVGIELKVKPLIGSNGVIQMEIDQRIETVGQESIGEGGGGNPSFNRRQASSYVSVQDGQMVVLGGLQQVETIKGDSKVFILGDLPIIGNLFRPKNSSERRNEILIFIRPVVVKNTTEANADAETKLDQIESSERVREYLRTGTFRASEPPAAHETQRVLRRGEWVEIPASN
jgi:general secretion pathway protein D